MRVSLHDHTGAVTCRGDTGRVQGQGLEAEPLPPGGSRSRQESKGEISSEPARSRTLREAGRSMAGRETSQELGNQENKFPGCLE
jgi:hypothetical protein